MATIGQISQAAGYQGNAALGGEIDAGITIDPSPIQRLATFTYYRDRDLWEKKNADDKLAAQQIANLAAFDISSPLKPYYEDLKTELSDIQTFVRENPDALVYSRNPDKFRELNERINRFATKRKGATANDVLYNAAKSNINKIPDPRERDIKLRELDLKVDKLFENGLEPAYNNQLESSPEIKKSDFEIPVAGQTTRSFIMQLPNSDITTDVTYTDLDDLRAKSEILAAGGGEQIDTNADWFKRLSPEQQKLELEKNSLTSTKRAKLQELSVGFSTALEQWKQANPNIDLTTVDVSTLPNGILEDNIRSVKTVNDQIDQLNALVLEGQIKDPAGRVRTQPYAKINFEDGLSEAEIIMMKSIQESKTPLLSKVDKKIQQTDNAIQLENIRADNARAWAGLNWDKEKFRLQTQGTEEVKNGATVFADRIYKELMNLSGGTGQITPSQQRQLTVEQRKYLGFDVSEESDGKVVNKLKPIDLSGKELIVLDSGKISVLNDAKLDKTTNKWVGKFDNTKSTTISNIATNRLNEQLQKSGSKELNSYIPLDEGNIETQSTTTGGGTTVFGSTSVGGSVPVYKKSDLLKGGWTEKQIKTATEAGRIKVN